MNAEVQASAALKPPKLKPAGPSQRAKTLGSERKLNKPEDAEIEHPVEVMKGAAKQEQLDNIDEYENEFMSKKGSHGIEQAEIVPPSIREKTYKQRVGT